MKSPGGVPDQTPADGVAGLSALRKFDSPSLRGICYLIVLAFAAALRLTALDADPPTTLTNDFISDESWWAHNARNHALFGHWRLDDFNQSQFAAPLHMILERISFEIGGVNLRQARLVSALAGLLTVFLVGQIMKREEGFRASIAGMGILTFDYFTLSYDRSGFVEPLPTTFMCLSIFLATRRYQWRIGLVLSGVAAFLACLAKLNSVFFLATPLACALIRPRADDEILEPHSRRNDALAYLAGLAIPAMIYGALFVAPNLSEFLSQNGRLREESRIPGPLVILNLMTFALKSGSGGSVALSGFLSESLLPTLLGMLWLIHFLSRASRIGLRASLRTLTWVERIALVWMVGLLPYFAMQDNYQERRYYVFGAPLAMLGAHLFAYRSRELIEIRTTDLRPLRAAMVVGVCLFVVLLYVRAPVAFSLDWLLHDVQIGEQPGLSMITRSFLATILVAAISIPILWAILHAAPKSRWTVTKVALIVGLIGGSIELTRIVGAVSSLSFTLDRASRAFASRLEDGDRVIDGHPFIMGTKCRNLILVDRTYIGYPYYGLEFLDEYRPTHVMFGGDLTEESFESGLHRLFGNRYRHVPRSLEVFTACPDGKGGMRIVATLGRVVPASTVAIEK